MRKLNETFAYRIENNKTSFENQTINQIDIGVPLEQHHNYTHNLVKFAIVGLIIGIIVLMFWSSLFPKFDDNYVRGLLARHDSNLAWKELTEMDTEEADGRSTLANISTVTFFDSNKLPAVKEIEIVSSDNGTIIDGSIVMFATVPMNIGSKRTWNCPNGTYYNFTIEETEHYLYVGIINTYLPYLQLEQSIEQYGGLNSSIETSWNESWNSDMWKLLQTASQWMVMSEVYYFNPGERSEFDEKVAEIEDIVKSCEEVLS